MVQMARILVVGVVLIAGPCAFAELKPTRQPISANAAAETNFMLSPLCVSLRPPCEPVATVRLPHGHLLRPKPVAGITLRMRPRLEYDEFRLKRRTASPSPRSFGERV